jgi:hypothetical protein
MSKGYSTKISFLIEWTLRHCWWLIHRSNEEPLFYSVNPSAVNFTGLELS